MYDFDFTIKLGYFIITPLFWGAAVAFIASSFSIWKRMREDYPEDEIFQLTVFLLFSSILLFFIFNKINLPIFGIYSGIILGLGIWALFRKINIWDIFDYLALPLGFLLIAGGVSQFLLNINYWDLSYLVLGVLLIIFFNILKKKYRSFSWYKSGKTGFLFWSSSLLIFILLFIIAFFKPHALYLEHWLYLVVSLGSIVVIYIRSERKILEDLKFFNKWQK